jgi:hypothetical protein
MPTTLRICHGWLMPPYPWQVTVPTPQSDRHEQEQSYFCSPPYSTVQATDNSLSPVEWDNLGGRHKNGTYFRCSSAHAHTLLHYWNPKPKPAQSLRSQMPRSHQQRPSILNALALCVSVKQQCQYFETNRKSINDASRKLSKANLVKHCQKNTNQDIIPG